MAAHRPIQVTGLAIAAVRRVRAELIEAGGNDSPSDAAVLRFSFTEYHRSLVARDRDETKDPATPPGI